MRFWIRIGAFVMAIGLVQGQDLSQLNSYLQTSKAQNQDWAFEKVDHLLGKLKAKSKKSDRQFLRNVFNLTHRQILKEYDQYSEFADLFEKGKYDCLTATALYSIILGELGYSHSIIETNYHIFLLVDSNEGQILMESTDPLGGFEYETEKIQARINAYKNNQEIIVKNEMQHLFSFSIFDKVDSEQLTGLLYYNQSVKAFNNQNWSEAIYLLNEAKRYYNSPRTAELENLLLSVASSK